MKPGIREDLISARNEYLRLLDAYASADMKRRSKNSGWTNGELFFHMLLGFLVVSLLFPLVNFFARLPGSYSRLFAGVLNAGTPLFNACNALGARIGGRIISKKGLSKRFSSVIDDLLKRHDGLGDTEWKRGMYFPDKWDGLFDPFMTYTELFRYPVNHMRFHIGQLS